ncbi:MAG: penicillin acylase family protein [Alphaproteobacteria bacterium]|nr:penicillin acylase family protein [Alphaproteobacteria bacterium]
MAAIAVATMAAATMVMGAAGARAQERGGAAALAARAQNVEIARDVWGVPHITGKTDADAVFGMMYAQAEDDFRRVEMNYVRALGRRAEIEGAPAIWADLRARMYNGEVRLKALYATCPPWLKALSQAWADGLNHYLATHPEVKPQAITRFEPWMTLAFTEGSIGGDIESIDLDDLRRFYGPDAPRAQRAESALALSEQGSNGIAIAPKNTKNGHALLLINPHTSLYFRSEAQVTSGEGLNAYGASTWGQFFVYQGFNEKAGWMHTTSGLVRVSRFVETVSIRNGRHFARFAGRDVPIATETVTIPYRVGDDPRGGARTFTIYRTTHGPVIARQDDAAGGRGTGAAQRWISFSMMNRPVEALQQSFLRTKVRSYAEFEKVAALQANSSNNTIFADAEGAIALDMPHFIAKRSPTLDYTAPVDGSDPAAAWQGMHPLAEVPRVVNPATGFVFNTNNWIWSAAGDATPPARGFPRYMDAAGENARGVQALRLLSEGRAFTLETLRDAAYDTYQPAFAALIPGLVAAYDQAPASSPLKARLAEPIDVLRRWDFRSSTTSVAMSLAQVWGDEIWSGLEARYPKRPNAIFLNAARDVSDEAQLATLSRAVERLERDFGTWKTPWGEINRYQRLTPEIAQRYDDAAPSLPIAYTSQRWGALPAFVTTPRAGTKRYYGDSGNSFVAVVEFGPRVRAMALTAGGQSGDPASPHFADQAALYARGELRPVYFYPDELAPHVTARYRPGERAQRK